MRSVFTLVPLTGCGTFNLFPPSQDRELGRQVAQEIESNPQEYPILPEQGNEEVYRFIRDMTQKILNIGKVDYRNEPARAIAEPATISATDTSAPSAYWIEGVN